MRTGSSNAAERAYHAAGGGGGNRTPVSARTPRREPGSSSAVVHASGGHARERALQDPGLKDYVCWTDALPTDQFLPRPAPCHVPYRDRRCGQHLHETKGG